MVVVLVLPLFLAGCAAESLYNPLGDQYRGIVYPPDITPDEESGIGDWSDSQIGKAVRPGFGRHA